MTKLPNDLEHQNYLSASKTENKRERKHTKKPQIFTLALYLQFRIQKTNQWVIIWSSQTQERERVNVHCCTHFTNNSE
jgi:hypothetical protein